MVIASLVVAGAIGAVSRYLVDGWIQHRVARTGFAGHPFWGTLPWGTLVINVTGSSVLGIVVGLARYHGMGSLPAIAIGTGFCGALTTFSTFSYESIRLLERGAILPAATNTVGSVLVGLIAAGVAIAVVAAA